MCTVDFSVKYDDGETPRIPTLAPAPTPVIPDEYIAFIDATQTFSIRYPPDWELQQSQIKQMDSRAQEIINERGVDVGVVITLFAAASTATGRKNPIANVNIEGLSEDLTLDEYVESGNRVTKLMYSTSRFTREQPTKIGGNTAHISEWDLDLSEIFPEAVGRYRNIVLSAMATELQAAFNVTCGFALPDEVSDAYECELVVNSFRLLR
jgi:hypothetical protein